jgi:peptidoglycan-N-acetylglucosamine deacetylase
LPMEHTTADMKTFGTWTLEKIPIDPGINMLTVDVECWHQLIHRRLTGKLIPPSETAVQSTRQVLSLFRERKVSATFFVLGYIAVAFPDLVREIADQGHEVAAHGHSHIPLWRLSTVVAREDIRRSVELLTELTGKPVLGFRAPEFSILQENLNALEILSDLGLKYDSSIFPMTGPRYGISDFPTGVTRIGLDNGTILEVPPSVVRFGGRSLPVAGGGYFRLLPYPLIRRAVRTVNSDGRPIVVYSHPYEFGQEPLRTDRGQRPIDGARARWVELRFNLFRRSMRAKLNALLDEFTFSSIEKVLENVIEK